MGVAFSVSERGRAKVRRQRTHGMFEEWYTALFRKYVGKAQPCS